MLKKEQAWQSFDPYDNDIVIGDSMTKYEINMLKVAFLAGYAAFETSVLEKMTMLDQRVDLRLQERWIKLRYFLEQEDESESKINIEPDDFAESELSNEELEDDDQGDGIGFAEIHGW